MVHSVYGQALPFRNIQICIYILFIFQAGSLPVFDLVFSFSSVEHSGLGEELLLILIVCHNRKCYFALCREIWRPPKPLGRHNHSCRDLVCFLPWCEWDLRTSEYFHLSRLVLCWGCPQMWRGKTDQQAKTWFILMLIGAIFLWPDLYSLISFRIYGPRLYPYLTTNWEFIWPGPGKR